MIIAGIDPGLATTGFAIINKTKEGIKVIDYGCINTDPGSKICVGDRLKVIQTELNKLIKIHQPEVLAVERLFFFKNLKTVMPVSEAKGVILLTAARNKIPVYEYTPLQMKMAVTGYGRADKKQVQKMIKTIFNLEEKPEDKNKRKDDATDALGVALCYALHANSKLRVSTN